MPDRWVDIYPGSEGGSIDPANSKRRPKREQVPIQFDGKAIGEPQRGYNFSVTLPSIGPEKPFVESVDVAPVMETIQIKPEPIGGRHIFSAIEKTASTLTLTFYVESSVNKQATYTALEYIDAWQSLIQNDDGTFNYPDSNAGGLGYSRDITVNLLMIDTNIGYQIEYKGCFPINISPMQFSFKDGSSRSRLTVTFSVDKIVPYLNGEGTVESTPNTSGELPSARIQNLDIR